MNTDIKSAAEIILNGGLILYPTDTIWGIGCDALNREAVEKVFRLKQRADSKSLIILLAEAKDIFQYVATPPPDILDLLKNLERPTTVIYDQAIGLPDKLIAGDGSIGIRVTKDEFCKRLIKKTGLPLVSTSANISGRSSAKTFPEISEDIKNGVDYIVRYRREDLSIRPASRIIRLLAGGEVEVLRE
ncbi:MAG TPA: L-threonylcarbamoyladenylate synthase [Edaphocola sp.]|nr:L-threonylcarbamoyladenylate synthase [Edaphocola sp.]